MCQAAILDDEGELLDETRFMNTPEGIEMFAESLTATGDEVKAVLESTGNLWIQVHDRLEEHGIPVALSSPTNSRLISDSRLKTDRTDARALARLHRAGVLSTCYVPGTEERSRRELLRHRLRLVKNRTQVRNRTHALLDKHGVRIPYKTKFSKKAIAWMKDLSLGFMDDAILRSDLALLGVLDEQIGFVEEKLAALAVDDPRVRLLMTMTGVDYFAAMLVLAEMVTVDRFRGEKGFCSWMGLAPRVWQSGEKVWVGGAGGFGNRRMRWLMIQCAHVARRHDPRLRRLYERHERRKGGKSAVAAVAHEMARIMYYMLRNGEPYRGVKVELWERKLKRMEKNALIGLRN
ncbi:MAG: IS110 family transposase [Candidatus Bathyarchaeota archaeon]